MMLLLYTSLSSSCTLLSNQSHLAFSYRSTSRLYCSSSPTQRINTAVPADSWALSSLREQQDSLSPAFVHLVHYTKPYCVRFVSNEWGVSPCAVPLSALFGVVYTACSKLIHKWFADVTLFKTTLRETGVLPAELLSRPFILELYYEQLESCSIHSRCKTMENLNMWGIRVQHFHWIPSFWKNDYLARRLP